MRMYDLMIYFCMYEGEKDGEQIIIIYYNYVNWGGGVWGGYGGGAQEEAGLRDRISMVVAEINLFFVLYN